MNDGSNFNIDDNYNVEDQNKGMLNQDITYSSYYNHQPRKKPWGIIFSILIIIVIIIVSLYYGGVFTPMDREAEYNKVYNRVCDAAVSYANKNNSEAKAIPGKIVYVTVGDLINENLIEASLRNYRTNEPIEATTDIKLEVMPTGTFQCHGFVWPGTDTVKPVVTLVGDAIIRTTVGVPIKDPGATALDDQDGDITYKIYDESLNNRSGNVNFDNPGTYYVYYSVSDRAGNLSARVTRTFIVQ